MLARSWVDHAPHCASGFDGQCLEQPAELRPFAKKMCIRSFRTVERYGVIFALLAPQSAAMPFVEMFGRDDLEANSGVYFTHFSMIRNYNYFQDLENLVDSSHVPFLHGRSAFRVTESDEGDVAPAGSDVATISAKETEYGLLETSSNPGGIARSILYVMPNPCTSGPARIAASWTWNRRSGSCRSTT